MRPALLVCVLSVPLLAQLGGPYPTGGPFPGGGQIPGTGRGRNPNGGVGSNGNGRETGRGKDKKAEAAVVTTTDGLLRRATSNQIVIEADDHRVIWYHVPDNMTYEEGGNTLDPKKLAVGDHVSVDSTSNDEGVFTATSLTRRSAGSAEDRATASRDWDLPPLFSGRQTASASAPRAVTREPGDDRPVLRRNRPSADDDSQKADDTPPAPPVKQASAPPPAAPQAAPQEEAEDTRPATVVRPPDPRPDADDPGRPVLKRGGPAQKRVAETDTPVAPARAPSTPATATTTVASKGGPGPRLGQAAPTARDQFGGGVPLEDDPVIAKAREAAATYLEGLPNFFAKQMTTRYMSENPRQGWQAQDIVTADVAYEDGHESYKNIKIGNKATAQSMEEIPGTRSSGEFATLLIEVMDPGGQAAFRRTGTDSVRGRSSYTYKFEINRVHSRWRVESPSQLYYPAYGGTIWIDKETSRVLRIEMDARKIPTLFPFDTIETTADYDYVRLESQSFLLPVESEVLSCQRGSSICSRNKIEFRNYRKFGAESDITFDSTVK